VSGYLQGSQGFVSTLGPLMGGWLVVTFGILSPFYFKAIISGIIIFIYGGLYYKLRK